MSLTAWKTLDDDGRRVALDGLLERLPTWLELLDLLAQPRFRDARSGETWRLFPGGPVTMGLTPEREAAIEALRLRDPLLLFDPTPYLPVREVTVAPFFLMETPILEEDGEPRVLVMDAMRDHHRDVAAVDGFRRADDVAVNGVGHGCFLGSQTFLAFSTASSMVPTM